MFIDQASSNIRRFSFANLYLPKYDGKYIAYIYLYHINIIENIRWSGWKQQLWDQIPGFMKMPARDVTKRCLD